MVLKSRDYVYKDVYLRNCLLYSTVYMYTGNMYNFILKKLSFRAAVVANQSITTSMLGVSDR